MELELAPELEFPVQLDFLYLVLHMELEFQALVPELEFQVLEVALE
jgi:hypothetical protein